MPARTGQHRPGRKGPGILPQLQSALETSRIWRKRRLTQLVDRLSDRPSGAGLHSLAACRVGNVQMLARDEKMRDPLSSRNDRQPPRKFGTGTGDFGRRRHGADDISGTAIRRRRTFSSDSAPLIVSDSGRQLWAAALGSSGPIRLFDLIKNEVSDPFQQIQPSELCAIDSRGVFSLAGTAFSAAPVVVLKPKFSS